MHVLKTFLPQFIASLALVGILVDAPAQLAQAATAEDNSVMIGTAIDTVTPHVFDGDSENMHLTPAAERENQVYHNVPVTAYSSTPDQTDSTPFITATGTHVRDGVFAANFLPIGTRVRIPEVYGDKIFVVEDRMNARYWYRGDIWMSDRKQATDWGIKYVTLEVYKP